MGCTNSTQGDQPANNKGKRTGGKSNTGGNSNQDLEKEAKDNETNDNNDVLETSNVSQNGSKNKVNSKLHNDMVQKSSRDTDVQSKQSKGGKQRQQQYNTSREPVIEKGYKAIPIEKEKGYLKRIRENLRQATSHSDIEELENAIHNFEKNRLEDNGDLTDAQERLNFLYLRKELRDAILRRHPGILDKAIYNVESSPYTSELSQSLDIARKLRDHMTELDRYRHDILEMDQSTISEIRSYHHPPSEVHAVMMGTYMLLGYDEEKLSDWTDVQCLLGRYGKESLIREIKNADTVNIDESICRRVKKIQSKISQEKIREVSNGAAAFYVWNENMSNKATKDRQQQHQQGPSGKQSAVSNSKQKQNTNPRNKNQG